MNNEKESVFLPPLFVCLYKFLYASVPAPFCIVRKTCGKLPLVFVVGDTLTAAPFARAGLVRAVTPLDINFLLALHASIAADAAAKRICGCMDVAFFRLRTLQ